jgi:two-component system sensor histidine kinase BarA
MDGLEVARAVRQRPPGHGGQVPILGLTADASPDNRDRVLEAGMDDCLTKPTDERQLWSRVGRLLGAGLAVPSRQATETPLPSPTEAIHPGELPHRDREAAIRIAAGNPDLAREMFEKLAAGLPEQIQEVRGYLFQRNWALLRESLHRLRGATAICAVSALHASVGALMEAARREAYDEALGRMDQVDSDARALVLTADRPELSSTSTPTCEKLD